MINKREFLKVSKELYKRGYRRNFRMSDLYKPGYSGLFYYYYKVIDETKDEYGDRLVLTQLLFRPWSLWEFRDRLPDSDNWLSFEPVIMFGRSSSERIDLSLSHPERSIDELEQIAKDFGEWCKQNVREIKNL
jgi:hypothetical protein